MATFEEHIEGLTRITIESSGTAPTETELQGFLRDGIKDCVNKIIRISPSDAFKFTKESQATNDNGITVTGKVLSVVRHHDSASILRVCTPMPSQLRYEATDVESLHYRSKYNPGYYLLDGKIHSRPAAAGSDNDLNVSQVYYDTGIEPSNNYNEGAIDNFPIEYEYLVALYGAAQSCQSAAVDIQNDMPTQPTPPEAPVFSSDVDAEIPDFPIVSAPELKIDFSQVHFYLGREDLDGADKALNIIDKEFEIFKQQFEIEKAYNEKNDSIFKSDMERLLKDADRSLQREVAEFKHAVEKYTADVGFYNAQLSEKLTTYKWYMEQYINLVNQYNAGIASIAKPTQKKQERPQRKGDR